MSSMIWRCPECHDTLLQQSSAALVCVGCSAAYPVVGGIPDFRPADQRSLAGEREVDTALELVNGPAAGDRDALVRAFFVSREGPLTGGREYTEKRIRGTLTSFDKLEREVGEWLEPLAASDGVVMDVGCGLGATVAALSRAGIECVGIDNRLDLLIVTRAILLASLPPAHVPEVAAGDALRLPLADETLGGIIYYDVVEHVPDVLRAMKEAERVCCPGGRLAIATPNRFSLAAEPHVGVWGVGWLPRRFQVSYASRRSGVFYSGTVLLSASELARIIERSTDFKMVFDAPRIPEESTRSFGSRRAFLARSYNAARRIPAVNSLLVRVGPFFHAVGQRGKRPD